jgi:hypothetical protein
VTGATPVLVFAVTNLGAAVVLAAVDALPVKAGAEFVPAGVPALVADVTCAEVPVNVGAATDPVRVACVPVNAGALLVPAGVPPLTADVVPCEPENVAC